MTEHEGLVEELCGLLKAATARPWVAFDEGGIRAIMKGKRPPSKANGYPSRRWPEIVKWTGFDGADVPENQRGPNLHLIVGAVNALPKLLDEIERLSASLAAMEKRERELAREVQAFHHALSWAEDHDPKLTEKIGAKVVEYRTALQAKGGEGRRCDQCGKKGGGHHPACIINPERIGGEA